MTPRNRMAFILATAAASLLASTGSGRLPMVDTPQPSNAPPRPTLPREPRSPVDALSRRQRKRARVEERQRAAAGISGNKLAKKAAAGKL